MGDLSLAEYNATSRLVLIRTRGSGAKVHVLPVRLAGARNQPRRATCGSDLSHGSQLVARGEPTCGNCRRIIGAHRLVG